MKIFEFGVDFGYEDLNTENRLSAGNHNVLREGSPNQWEEVDFFVTNPLQKKCKFYRLLSRIVLKPCLRDSPLQRILAGFGLFYDLTVEGESGYQLWIPTLVLDAVDLNLGSKMRVADYEGVVFRRELFEGPTIFRVPSFPRRQFLSTGYGDNKDRDFYATYHGLELEGLEFVLAWEES